MKKMLIYWKVPLLLCCLAVALEFFVFNFRHWESYLWRDEHVLMQEWLVGPGLRQIEPTLYEVTEAEGEETATIELLNINRELHNIHVGLKIENPSTPQDEAVNIQLKVTDGANQKYFRLPERDILYRVPKSEYIRLQLSGPTEEVQLIINAEQGDRIRIYDVSGNVPVPFTCSAVRLAAVMLLLLAAWFLRPSSSVHRRLYVECGWKGRVLVAVILCANILAAGYVERQNLQAIDTEQNQLNTRQYQMLAHSLAEGKTWLMVEPDEMLKSLSNPYDYRLRSMTLEPAGVSYLWDAAYYNGRYYVYFGIVPELLFFLPYYLATGNDLSVLPVLQISGAFFMAGVFALLGAAVRRWFRKTPFTVWLLFSFLAANACGVWSFFRNPTFYNVPILCALALGVWGLWLWMKALEPERVSRWKMAAGSFLLALTAGCRPQLVLVSVLAVPLFWSAVREGRLLKDRKAADAASFCLPFLLVAAGLMYYNQIRFGSVFDFGAAYNLTLQDMRQRKMEAGRTVFGYFTTLFQPPVITGVFPYFEQVSVRSQYYGQSIIETGFGGVMAVNLILFASLAVFRLKKLVGGGSVYAFSCMMTGLALLLAFVDFQIGGLIPRYAVDYTWLFFLAAAPVVFGSLEKVSGTKYWKTGYGIFLALSAQSAIFHFLTVFTDVYEKIEYLNPVWFYRAEHLIEFWL